MENTRETKTAFGLGSPRASVNGIGATEFKAKRESGQIIEGRSEKLSVGPS